MADGEPRPRLRRAIEALPATAGGAEVVVLRDPSGVAGAALTVSRGAVAVLALLDGTRTVRDVQAEIMRRHGELVPRDRLDGMIATLEEHLFLDGPRLETARAAMVRAFREEAVRAAAHAGGAYAADPEALHRAWDDYFAHAQGPGPPGPPARTRLSGLVAPHIDFHRGGPGYAWAYRALLEAEEVDCFVVLGTAHAGLDGHPFAATGKPYATPLGPLPVDEEVLGALVRRAPGDLFAAEAAHRREHSIEFQAVSIRYAAKRRGWSPGPRFVPLLASFAHECLADGRDPASDRRVAGTLEALAGVMATVPRRYCLVAGADLAHVGPQFGDPAPVSADDLAGIAHDDRAMLEHVTAGDAAGFFRSVAADGDRRRICGLSPIYALLRLLPPSAGRLLHYGQWPDPHGTVTYASVAFAVGGPEAAA